MSTHRNILLGSGAVVAALSLALSGTVASVASTAPSYPVPARATLAAGPNPNAPHAGFVQGVQRGPNISIRNARSVHAFRVLHQDMLTGKPASADPQTIHPSVGTSFNSSSSLIGSQANQSVSTKIKPKNPGTTLYTPTMYPSGGTQGSCIEMSTAYFYGSQVVAAWDWCQAITFVAEVTINKSFMQTYTKKGYYSTQIVQTTAGNNTWTSYLYNYKTSTWEQFFQQNGSSEISASTPGWDVYELYSEIKGNGQSYACADLRGQNIQANKIMVNHGGTWALADETNSGHAYDHPDGDFQCKDFAYTIIKHNSHFKVHG